MASQTVLDLSKRLLELDAQAKAVRNEVENLRAMKRSIEVGTATESKVSVVRESECSRASSKARRPRPSAHKRGYEYNGGLPTDFLDDLNKKASEVDRNVKTHRELLKEKETLLAALEHAEMKAEEEEQLYITLSEIAGEDEDGHSRSAAGTKKRNQYSAAVKDAMSIFRTRDVCQHQLGQQGKELERLAAVLEETTDAAEQLQEATDVLAERQAKLAQLRREREQMERTVHTKDAIADKRLIGPSEEDFVRHSNFDRRVAMHELNKEDKLIKSNDLAIRHRAVQIAKLQTRLELIGDAVAGDGLSEEERVDIELVNELMQELRTLHDAHLEANIRMDHIDCEIEKMEWRKGAMQQAKDSTVTEADRIDREHRRYLQQLEGELQREKNTNGRTINKLEDDIQSIRRSKSRGQKSSVSTTSKPRSRASVATN